MNLCKLSAKHTAKHAKHAGEPPAKHHPAKHPRSTREAPAKCAWGRLCAETNVRGTNVRDLPAKRAKRPRNLRNSRETCCESYATGANVLRTCVSSWLPVGFMLSAADGNAPVALDWSLRQTLGLDARVEQLQRGRHVSAFHEGLRGGARTRPAFGRRHQRHAALIANSLIRTGPSSSEFCLLLWPSWSRREALEASA